MIRWMNVAIGQSTESASHTPLANMPVRRTPCFATQKICASVYSVPAVGSCGASGFNALGKRSSFPGVPCVSATSGAGRAISGTMLVKK